MAKTRKEKNAKEDEKMTDAEKLKKPEPRGGAIDDYCKIYEDDVWKVKLNGTGALEDMPVYGYLTVDPEGMGLAYDADCGADGDGEYKLEFQIDNAPSSSHVIEFYILIGRPNADTETTTWDEIDPC